MAHEEALNVLTSFGVLPTSFGVLVHTILFGLHTRNEHKYVK